MSLIDALPETTDLSDALMGFLAWVEEGGRSPWPHQEEALMELAAGAHVMLETPTGSGKSLVALGLHALAFSQAERSVYTAPIKALVNEKFFALCDDLGAENVGLMTGDASVNRDAPVLCCTAEVLAQLALTEGDDAGIAHVVMDEFHYYGDGDRGMAWHLPLFAMPKTRFLLMSATLGDTRGIREALAEATGREVAHVRMTERPVPLHWEYVETPIHETMDKLVQRGKAPVYLVHSSQREAAEQAQALMSQDLLDKDAKTALKKRLQHARFPSPYGQTLKRHLLHGVGLHHAGLLPRYRLLVERLAQEGKLAAISGTDTLGVGVNVPIRTVLMTSLSRFDGKQVRWPTVRDFHQVAGRAGRAGFDTEGLVVVQAPPWIIENIDRERKAQAKGKKKWRKATQPDRVKAWDKSTFERLRDGLPEELKPVFRVSPGLLLEVLRREHRKPRHRFGGYGAVIDLIAKSHLTEEGKRAERRRASHVFRALRRAGVIRLAPMVKGRGKRVVPDPDLPRDLSLTHALSLWLVEAVAVLDGADADHALNVISVVESVVDDPAVVLRAQAHREKGKVIGQLKAEGVPYEERMEALEEVTHPRPLAEWLAAVFEPWSEAHPWVESRGPRPKSIVRDMVETGATFAEYVRELGLARAEGVLLRYLAQVWRLLARGLPDAARTPEVLEVIGWLRGVLAHTDDSLVAEWERMATGAERDTEHAEDAPPDALVRDPRAFKGRLKAEMHALVDHLAAGEWDEAAEGLRTEDWGADDLKKPVQKLLFEHGPLCGDHRARQPAHLTITRAAPDRWIVEQALLDGEGEVVGVVRAVANTAPADAPAGPVLEVEAIDAF
jgi:superfamily II RNA helicase